MIFKIQPWAHQLKAIENASHQQNYALFFEMGTGKTGTLINIYRDKCNTSKRLLKALVFCPPIVIKNWKDEFLKHSSVDPSKIVLLTGSGKDRLKTFEGHKETPHVFVTNYEGLLMEPLFKAMCGWQPEFLVYDESHKLKDYKAKRSKLAHTLANPVGQIKPMTFLLSGTPVLNSPMDLFHQYKIMDGGKTFGDNFFAFRGRYFYDKNANMPRDRHFPLWLPHPGALDDINKKMLPTAMRVEKKECLDLPPMVYQTIKVDMAPDQRAMYESMKKDLIAIMDDRASVAKLAITKALRLQQIASGFVKFVGDEEVSLSSNPKLDALEELLRELTPHHKVLVWAVFKKNYEQIRGVCEKLKIKYVEVHGEVSNAGKLAAVEEFTTDKECRVFIGHPGSGGIGINLVQASYSIFYSRSFSLEQSTQAESRNHRSGAKEAGHEKITRIDLVCDKSIDELVTESLLSKQVISLDLLKNLNGDF